MHRTAKIHKIFIPLQKQHYSPCPPGNQIMTGYIKIFSNPTQLHTLYSFILGFNLYERASVGVCGGACNYNKRFGYAYKIDETVYYSTMCKPVTHAGRNAQMQKVPSSIVKFAFPSSSGHTTKPHLSCI